MVESENAELFTSHLIEDVNINIVKICIHHGKLNKNQIIKEGNYLRCYQCKIDKDRKWKQKHRDKHIACSTKWKQKNREHYNEWCRNDRSLNPDKYKKWSADNRARIGDERNLREVLRRRKLTREAYDQMFSQQNGRCAICKKEETRKSRTKGKIARLAIDHCHKTQNVRGLLCHACNLGIGTFLDSPELLESAIKYLKGFDSGGAD